MNYKSLITKWGVLVFALICFAASDITAQKIGHMNSGVVFAEMPKTKAAKSQLENYTKQLESDFKSREEQLAKKIESAEKKYTSGEMTQNELQNVQAEIQKQGAELEKTRQQMMQKLVEREENLMEPLVTSLNEAIEAVAKENGYNFIIDSSALLYAEDAEDVTALVKAKLGM